MCKVRCYFINYDAFQLKCNIMCKLVCEELGIDVDIDVDIQSMT